MAPSNFPSQNDRFTVPTDPGSVPLGQRGDASRNHTESHRDIGDAVIALQENVPVLNHDHSGSGSRATSKLKQVNTHESADTDKSASSLHHTLGTGANQSMPGNAWQFPPVGHQIELGLSYYGKTRPTIPEGRRTISGLSERKNTSTAYFRKSGSSGVVIQESGLYFVKSYLESYSSNNVMTSRWHRTVFAMPTTRDPQYTNIKSSHYRNNNGNEIVGIRHTSRALFEAVNIRWIPKGTVITIEAQSISAPWELEHCTLFVVALFNRPGEPLAVRGLRDK